MKHPDTLESRLALHEAGHLIAVWCCSSVENVRSATIRSSDGAVLYEFLDGGKADHLWCRTVIAMAGLAAEMMAYRTARSGNSRQDLTQALEAAQQLATMCDAKEAFPIEPDTAICSLYACPLSSDERHILGAAYAKAKTILTRLEGPFLRVVSMLLTHRQLTQPMIEKELGPRAFIQASPQGRFVIPKKPLRGKVTKPPSWLERMRGRLRLWFEENFSYSWP